MLQINILMERDLRIHIVSLNVPSKKAEERYENWLLDIWYLFKHTKKHFILSSILAWISAYEIGDNTLNILGTARVQRSTARNLHNKLWGICP